MKFVRLFCGNYSNAAVDLIGITTKNVENTLINQWKPSNVQSPLAYVTVSAQYVKFALVFAAGSDKIIFETVLQPLHYYTLIVDTGSEHKLIDHGTVPLVKSGIYIKFFNLLVSICLIIDLLINSFFCAQTKRQRTKLFR